jgi:hypothetical protein
MFMLKKSRFSTTLLSLGLAASLTGWTLVQAAETAPAEASPAPAKVDLSFPDGENWSRATEREKMAYLLGVRDMAAAEYQLAGPKPKHRTLVKKWVESLDGMTLRQIMETVDTYYKANPDKQQQTIFEVVWFQMVEPKVSNPAKTRPAKAN